MNKNSEPGNFWDDKEGWVSLADAYMLCAHELERTIEGARIEIEELRNGIRLAASGIPTTKTPPGFAGTAETMTWDRSLTHNANVDLPDILS